MVWPFTLTRTVSFRKNIHASPEAVLRLLHDINVLFAVNPLITHITPDPSNSSAYTVTDRLVVLGYFKTETKYKCWLHLRDDGLDTDVLAGLGTRLKGRYRVRAGENGTTELTEETLIEGLCFLLPYITYHMSRQLKQSHRDTESSALRQLSFTVVVMTAFTLCYLWPSSIGVLSYVTLAAMLSVVYWSKTATDPYGLFHLSLNKLPGESVDIPPKTEWLNMGFWQDTDVFPQACAALATKLIQAAQCKAGDRVLDVGHGTGESLVLLLSEASIPRPSTITGITSLPAHHHRSQERVDRLLASLKDPRPEVCLYLGDAVCQPGTTGHPLEPSSNRVFDRILALDCAYHFDTRSAFLQQALHRLAPGGRIALADICFDPKILLNRRASLITSLFKMMPKQNMVSTDNYIAQMEEMGYVDVQLEDITEDVFPGFVQFLKGRGIGWRVFGSVIEWYASTGARFVIVTGCCA
ncbi:S-adenosyl-L-methionine-dependent methyltransferase [Lyophyllum atratum]|nr:S-adenosyl-L-methionine-dependent methyltransferase [Lyophyllum atratum]